MSSSLVASKTGSHWTLAFIDVLASFSVVEQPLGETSVTFITLDREASSSGVEFIASSLEKLYFIGTVVWIGSYLDESLIDILSH